jgi:8-oxo-dGTP pyrophosphatase MutT (NUDIX family)
MTAMMTNCAPAAQAERTIHVQKSSFRAGLIIPGMDKEEIRRRLADSRLPDEVDGPLVAAGAAGRPLTPAAVLVALVASPNGPEIVLTQRTDDLTHHPGQISFPGGRVEPEDDGPVAAALREAWEEVGLLPERVEIIGSLPRYRTVSDYCVHPFVGWVERPVELVPDAREVADVFLLPLAFVLDAANHTRESMVHDGEERSFWVLPFDGRRIWGATAGMLITLARALG